MAVCLYANSSADNLFHWMHESSSSLCVMIRLVYKGLLVPILRSDQSPASLQPPHSQLCFMLLFSERIFEVFS